MISSYNGSASLSADSLRSSSSNRHHVPGIGKIVSDELASPHNVLKASDAEMIKVALGLDLFPLDIFTDASVYTKGTYCWWLYVGTSLLEQMLGLVY